jgi:uncharacterized circularly permuted ATP-grasp superfamily protein/uncharacterized alpha-E superfamily protein
VSTPSEADYAVVEGHWDEMASPSGELRPHWRKLVAALRELGDAELARRWSEAQRLIEDHGVTYNVYGDPRGIDRPWQLDPIPLVIGQAEWASIEAAVAQRALLLDRMLADLYGPRRLLRESRLPPELVFANPSFQRPVHGIRVPGDCYLHVFAVDLARSPDGQWWALADRTQAPSGAGYALENRVVMARALPELFRDCYVKRLAGYFQAYRDTIFGLSPRANPRVVLLTPGPYNETYFEHAYLARYLGFTLVEGADLTVRDERVFLKTLSGLLPVDVILRRQDDAFCDPLELYGESALGTPGLVQAVRAGNVAVANALGSALVETAASMAFLPGLCRQLLSEELRMPSVATWWCGQQRECDYVIANLEELVVKSAFPSARREVVFGEELAAEDREALISRIRAAPHQFVAQERVALSTVPTGGYGGPSPRHLVLRVYAVRSGDGYSVMPGGLTRVSSSPDSFVVSSQSGGGSKDTWVLADAPVPYVSLMDRAEQPADVARGSFALTSRVADNLLWLGRMSERVEARVRMFRAALRRLSEEPIRAADAPPPDAVVLLERMGLAGSGTGKETPPDSVESRLLDALWERAHPNSLAAAAGELHRLAWLVRDRISPDAWRALARLDVEFAPADVHPALRVSRALDLLGDTQIRLSAFTGLVMESMTRGLGWQFLDVGRRLERGIQVLKLLRAGLVEEAPSGLRRLENVLEVADSSMTYRSRYLTTLQLPLVLDLLLADEANPHSVAFQLVRLAKRFASLPRAPLADVESLLERVRGVDIDELIALEPRAEGPPQRSALAALTADLIAALPAVADALNHAYLAHAVPRRQPQSAVGAFA